MKFFGEKKKDLAERNTKRREKAIEILENMGNTLPDDTTSKSTMKKSMPSRRTAS